MLVVEDNSVYEIDEECIQRKHVPPECKTAEKLRKCQNAAPQGGKMNTGHKKRKNAF